RPSPHRWLVLGRSLGQRRAQRKPRRGPFFPANCPWQEGERGMMANERPFRAAGVIGWPVAHSRSPRLHTHWLTRHGIAGAYLPLPVRPGRLEAALRGLAALGFAGCNVTVPHKEEALALVDDADQLARRIGAANLVVVRPDGSL